MPSAVDFDAVDINGDPLPESFHAYRIWATVPSFVKQMDRENGNILYYFVLANVMVLDQIASISQDNIGALGTKDYKNYPTAPGWSQILDIDRCPSYALPWLAQFVGVEVDSTQTVQQTKDAMKERANSQRGTKATIISALKAVVNSTIDDVSKQIKEEDIIVLEMTDYKGTTTFTGTNAASSTTLTVLDNLDSLFVGQTITAKDASGVSAGTTISAINAVSKHYGTVTLSSSISSANTAKKFIASSANPHFVHNDYALSILIPHQFYVFFSYGNLNETLGITTSNPDYLTVNQYIQDLSGSSDSYSNLTLNNTPTDDSRFLGTIYRVRPAGIKLYIGGY